MCWNQYVSINTFLFSIFGLSLIAFNNKYSSYKLSFFDYPYVYVFMLSFIFMQLIEYILWRNLNNPTINNIVSILGLLLLTIQPIASLLMINNNNLLRNKLLLVYSIPAAVYFVYNLLYTKIHTVLSPSGHLAWKWMSYLNSENIHLFVNLFYLFFMFFSLVYNKYYKALTLLFMYIIVNYYFHKDGSAGSIWCLSANILILYFLLKILVLLPFKEIMR